MSAGRSGVAPAEVQDSMSDSILQAAAPTGNGANADGDDALNTVGGAAGSAKPTLGVKHVARRPRMQDVSEPSPILDHLFDSLEQGAAAPSNKRSPEGSGPKGEKD